MNIRKEIEEIKEFANKIMSGDADGYDGADGARDVLSLCRLYEQLLLEERKKTLEEVEDGINNIQYGAEVQGNTMIDIKHIEEVLSKLKSK